MSGEISQKEIGENLDRLITLDVPARGVIGILYKAAREREGKPLTISAAKKLQENVRAKDTVIIMTGTQLTHGPVTETDGPIGAVVLARALNLGLRAIPIIVTDDSNLDVIKATSRGINLNVAEFEDARELPHSVVVKGFPIKKEEAEKTAKQLLDDLKPAAVIAIERPGWNVKKAYHTMRGFSISAFNADMDYVFEEATSRGILRIGIGDGGNEMGMGVIRDAIRQKLPYGLKCQCPCESGIISVTKSDILVTATISNWGGYGVAACLAALTEKLEVFHDEATELRAIRECVDAGALDGVLGCSKPSVDGLPDYIHASIVKMMQTTLRWGFERGFKP